MKSEVLNGNINYVARLGRRRAMQLSLVKSASSAVKLAVLRNSENLVCLKIRVDEDL
jgi:hypothetical protein